MEEKNTMMDFLDEIEKSMERIYKGDLLKGTVISVNEETVLVNINYISDGIIRREGMTEDFEYREGDVIPVIVLDPHDAEGNVVLTHREAEELDGWEDLEEAFKSKKRLLAKVTAAVKGGVSATYRNVSCFIPASLLSYRYVEDLSAFAGKTLEVVVEDFDREKKRVVLSRKAVESAERDQQKKQLMKELQAGEMRQGVVTKLMKFGAFVDLGGAEGLIHLDDLAWHRVNDPSEVVSEGDQVTVYVANIEHKTGKISLVLKNVDEDPWKGVADYYKVGDYVEAKVVRLLDFGAFVEVEEGVEGLVHISEISSDRVRKPSDVLKVGDAVQAVILKVDEENKKMSLSIKEAEGQVHDDVELVTEESSATLGDLFGDKFKDFFKK
ncbi:30S ribosomal protein S1 [Anoxybacterium hadale]|uniref:30S ribosomal protein S1 n=1 Tax=Anoxybacterium hadale TaxID=3408580 RepID=A0ACD1ADT2_9FIRM|nr:30S ribosomal protein S1 [Clostridiales bacterium]